MIEYPKLKIALEYLDAAIAEREFNQRYFSAMNLAGVAEELLGKIVRILGKTDRLTKSVDDISDIQDALWDKLGWQKRSKKDLKKLLSQSKNGIKHMESIADLNAKLFFDIEDESLWMIQAAICNLEALEIEHSTLVSEFIKRHKNQ